MTPQERQLMAELFTRLASLESAPRDPDAEAMIREGFRRAPNAAYALVQTVLVQDEALKAANNRIQDYEQQFGAPQQQQPEQPRGFLDSMREGIFGREEPRGSVPRVTQGGAPIGAPSGAPMGAPAGYGGDPWGRGQGQGYGQPGHAQMNQSGPMQAPPQQGGGGSSFLGTAAAAAAGMIGGSLLMGGIRSAMAGHQGGGPASKAFEDVGGRGEDRSPLSGGSGSGDLARDAGLNDIGGGRSGSAGTGEARRTGLFDSAESEGGSEEDSGYEGGDDFDSGDTEET
jgi:hypothetical protein